MSSGGYFQVASASNLIFSDAAANDVVLRSANSSSTLRMGIGSNVSSMVAVTSSGVGIGKAPGLGYALDVAGTINATSILINGSVLTVGSNSGGSGGAAVGSGNYYNSNLVSSVAVVMTPDYAELLQGASNLIFNGGSTYNSTSFTTVGGSLFITYSGTGLASTGTGKITATISLMSSGVAVANSTKITGVFSDGGQVTFPAIEYLAGSVNPGTYTVQIVFSSNMKSDANSIHNLIVKVLKNVANGSCTNLVLSNAGNIDSTSAGSSMYIGASNAANLYIGNSNVTFSACNVILPSAKMASIDSLSAGASLYLGMSNATSVYLGYSNVILPAAKASSLDSLSAGASLYMGMSNAATVYVGYSNVVLPAAKASSLDSLTAGASLYLGMSNATSVYLGYSSVVLPAAKASSLDSLTAGASLYLGMSNADTVYLGYSNVVLPAAKASALDALTSGGSLYIGSSNAANLYIGKSNIIFGASSVTMPGTLSLTSSLTTSNIYITGNIYQNGSLFQPGGGSSGSSSSSSNAASSIAGQQTLSVAGNSITISGLNMTADGGSYRIVVQARNPTASTFNYLMYINGDTTPANYFTESMQALGRADLSTAALTAAGANATHFFNIDLVAGASDGYHQANISGGYSTGTSTGSAYVQTFKNFMIHKATGNITSLTFTSDIASGNSFDVGASVTVYRVNILATPLSGQGSILLGEKALTKNDVQAAAASSSWTPVVWSATSMDGNAFGASSIPYTFVSPSSYAYIKTTMTVGADNGGYVQFLLQYSTDNVTWVDYLEGPGTTAQGQVTFGTSIAVGGGTYGLAPVFWETRRAISHTAGQTMYFRLQYRMPSGTGNAYINQQAYAGSNNYALANSYFSVQEIGAAALGGSSSGFSVSGSNVTLPSGSNVGIGVSNPITALQVAGTVLASGYSNLPVATSNAAGVVQVGAGLNVSSGVISNAYTSNAMFYSPGSVIQMQTNVYSTAKLLTITNTFYPFTDIDSTFGVTITPKFANSKLLIQGMLHIGGEQASDSRFTFFRIGKTVNSVVTEIGNGDTSQTSNIGTACVAASCLGSGAAGYNELIENVNITYVDTPATLLPITYRFRWTPTPGGQTSGNYTKNVTINRPFSVNDNWRAITISTITVTEIAQ